ncbi:MAG TPA: Wzz/FepE/Etk N-terminal domain-containing protein [Methyloceanibacter sp.]|nr:Wzz/FepE/Etk N-terminal domain-containing protein [Methyloceanibacter sp.]
MATSHEHRSDADDIDLQTLGRAVWRTKGWIFGLVIAAGLATFIGLSMVRPLYSSGARILIQNDESAFTRPTGDQGRDPQQRALDEQAVQSQVQVLTSRDLAAEVIKALDSTTSTPSPMDASTNELVRFLNRMGIARPSPRSEEENAANTFAEHLSVFQLAKSSVIVVECTSGASVLAAEIANKLADAYIDWRRAAKLEQTKDATVWFSTQIDVLRAKEEEAEAAVEQFKSSEGLFSGSNNITLSAQQLSDLNSQLIFAKVQRSEAEARARLIKKMLADKSDIDATSEVLKSGDRQTGRPACPGAASAGRAVGDAPAVSSPDQAADLRARRRQGADPRRGRQDRQNLENEAEVVAARETSLRDSLNDLQSPPA